MGNGQFRDSHLLFSNGCSCLSTAQLVHSLPISGIKKAVSSDGNKAKCLELHGGAERDRTVDLLTASQIKRIVITISSTSQPSNN